MQWLPDTKGSLKTKSSKQLKLSPQHSSCRISSNHSLECPGEKGISWPSARKEEPFPQGLEKSNASPGVCGAGSLQRSAFHCHLLP